MSAISPTAPPASRRPSSTPSAAPTRPKSSGFAQEEREDGGARGAEGAQDADFGAPPHHADGDGVVDQERADHQRDVAEDAQIPAEGAQHALVLVAARARLFEQVATAAAAARMAASDAAKSSPGPTVTSMRSSLP